MRRTVTRDFFIPAGALVVRDKASSAVCYIYADTLGRPCAMGFAGRRQKPDFRVRYLTPERREAAVRQYFAGVQSIEASRKQRQERPRKLQVGHVLYASWGYEQTNIDWYQVTDLVGDTMVELRKIAGQVTDYDARDQGRVVPQIDAFTGEPIRRRAKGDGVKIDDVRWASLWDGRPKSWSSYH